MASQLRVDKILPVDGAPTGGGGGIIQIQQTVKTDFLTISANDTMTDVTSVNITPHFTTSKIFVMVSGERSSSNGNNFAIEAIKKGAVAAMAMAYKFLCENRYWPGALTFTAVADETIFGTDGAVVFGVSVSSSRSSLDGGIPLIKSFISSRVRVSYSNNPFLNDAEAKF